MALFPLVEIAPLDQLLDLIARQVLGAPAASISFTGISTDYRIFELDIYMMEDGTASELWVRLNNDSSAVYQWQRINVSDTSVSAARMTGTTNWVVTSGNAVPVNTQATIHTMIAKPLAAQEAALISEISYRVAGPSIARNMTTGLYAGAALISRIDIMESAGNMAAGSAAVLNGDAHA